MKKYLFDMGHFTSAYSLFLRALLIADALGSVW